MLSFVEPQLADIILRGLHDLAAAATPPVAAAGLVLVLATATVLHLRRGLRRGRRPRGSLPAAA
jgi:hypothetical protein